MNWSVETVGKSADFSMVSMLQEGQSSFSGAVATTLRRKSGSKNFDWILIAQTLMRSLRVIFVDVKFYALAKLPWRGILVNVNILAFKAPKPSLNDYVINARGFYLFQSFSNISLYTTHGFKWSFTIPTACINE